MSLFETAFASVQDKVRLSGRHERMFKMCKHRNEMRAWQKRFDALAPKVGDIAPDFKLRDTDGENPIRLSEFKGKKPVGLIFGSFT